MTSKGITESLLNTFAGRVDYVAYGLASSWLIGMGLNWMAGSPMNLRTALLGLCGNLAVIAIALTIKIRRNKKGMQ